ISRTTTHNDWSVIVSTATTNTNTPPLHDALPIYDSHQRTAPRESRERCHRLLRDQERTPGTAQEAGGPEEHLHPRQQDVPSADRDRKSTRLNSSHVKTSYAVFCLKKKSEHEGRGW